MKQFKLTAVPRMTASKVFARLEQAFEKALPSVPASRLRLQEPYSKALQSLIPEPKQQYDYIFIPFPQLLLEDLGKERRSFCECYVENETTINIDNIQISNEWQNEIISNNQQAWMLFQDTGCFCMGGRAEYEKIMLEIGS